MEPDVTPIICTVHFTTVPMHEEFAKFSRKSFDKFYKCRREYLELGNAGGEATVVARNSLALCPDDADSFDCLRFHRACYKRFANIEQIRRAKKRRHSEISLDKEASAPFTAAERATTSEQTLPKRPTRSDRSIIPTSAKRRSEHVQPEICIICLKAEKRRKNSVSMKFVRERLSKAKTTDAGRLREAAENKCDERILREIRGKDCVAIEVQYHKSCYTKYISFLRNPIEPADVSTSKIYEKSYNIFCKNIIEDKIMKRHKVYYSTTLLQKFVTTVAAVEGVDASSYRVTGLKKRLLSDYPVLVFFTPKKRNRSEIVYSEFVQPGTIFESQPSIPVGSESSASGSSTFSVAAGIPTENEKTHLFKASQILRSCIEEVPDFSNDWPHTSSDISEESCLHHIVPCKLYNFLAWCMKMSDDPSIDGFISLQNADERKVLAISQDIIYHKTENL